jgi:putative polymerase
MAQQAGAANAQTTMTDAILPKSESGEQVVSFRTKLACAMLLLAVAYNAPLAIINAHILPLAPLHAILAEALLILTVFFIAMLSWRPDMTRWIMLIACMAAWFAIMSFGRGVFQPKDFRDTLLVAAFIMLGMTVPYKYAQWLFIAFHIIVAVVALFEIIAPASFSDVFNAKNYYINTRGFHEEQFFVEDSGLFNAYRPDERYFFPALNWLRASSIFLEPVGLGNYCTLATLMIILFWKDWRGPLRCFMVVIWFFILLASDGRFAGMTSLLILVLTPLFYRLPVTVAFFYMPMLLTVSAVVSSQFQFNPMQDNLPGRIARGLKYISKMDIHELSGFGIATPALADSGIAYVVTSQSIFGLMALQGCLYFLTSHMQQPKQRLMMHGGATMMAFGLLVSNSMLSIKTAGLLWFFTGVMLVYQSGKTTDRLILDIGRTP